MKRIYTGMMILLFVNAVYAAYEDIGNIARAKGMGNAFYGEPAGLSSIYYNPAGTAFSKSIEVMGTFGMPYAGFDTLSFSTFNAGFLFPFTHHFKYQPVFENASLSFAMNNLSLSYENSKDYTDDDIKYYERVYKINYSKDLMDMLGAGTRFAVGANFNLYSRGLDANVDTGNNYLSSGLDTSGLGIDLGFMMFLNMNMILGVVMDNILEPDVAFNKEISEQPIDRLTKLGLSYRRDKLLFFSYPTIAAGVAFESLKQDIWEYRLGFQFWTFEKLLGIRTGFETSDEGMNTAAMGLTGKKEFSKGHEIELSYAFNLPLASVAGSYGHHTFSLVYRYSLPLYQFEFDDAKRKFLIEKDEKEKQAQPVTSSGQK